LDSELQTISRPIVLAGHSYGLLMTNASTGNPNVKTLVFIAAFARDAGETIGGPKTQFPAANSPKPASTSARTRCPMGRPALRATSIPPYSATSSPPI